MEDGAVYALCRQIPKGKVSTYKAIADKLGTKAYRAIGKILSRNPYAPKVPCHRVVRSNGEVGGFMGSEENSRKVDLLLSEDVMITNGKIDLQQFLFEF